MVFHKGVRKNDEFRFFLDNQIIDVVQEYTYLGMPLFIAVLTPATVEPGKKENFVKTLTELK